MSSKLDSAQILPNVHDESNSALQVSIVAGTAELSVALDHTDDSVLVYGNDGGTDRKIHTDSSGDVQVDIASALPAGTNAIGKLAANDGVDIGDVTINNASGVSAVNIQDGGNSITVDGAVAATQSGAWNVTNVSGTVSLPTGASTAANQSTGNTSLSSIDGKLGSLGQKAMTGSAPVVIASDQSAIPASQSGTWNITNVSGTVSLPTGAATSAKQDTEISSLSSIDGKLSTPTTVRYGQNTDVDQAAEQVTASSGVLVNGMFIKALSTNTGIIYVGSDNSVTASNGYELLAGDSVFISCNNQNIPYVIASVDNQKVSFIGS